MIQAYSNNITTVANAPIPFNSLALKKGCTVEQTSPTTFALNKCGVYEVACSVSASASEVIQLYKDGVAVAEAQSTGTNPNFITLVQVNKNNNPCCVCDSPVTIQVMSENAVTLTDANIVVTKLV